MISDSITELLIHSSISGKHSLRRIQPKFSRSNRSWLKPSNQSRTIQNNGRGVARDWPIFKIVLVWKLWEYRFLCWRKLALILIKESSWSFRVRIGAGLNRPIRAGRFKITTRDWSVAGIVLVWKTVRGSIYVLREFVPGFDRRIRYTVGDNAFNSVAHSRAEKSIASRNLITFASSTARKLGEVVM